MDFPFADPPCDEREDSPQRLDDRAAWAYEARLGRIHDYQMAALEKTDPLSANLSSVNGGLFHISLELDQALQRALAQGPRTVEGLQKITPAIETHLRVTRQIERFAHLELRAEASRPTRPEAENSLPDPEGPCASAEELRNQSE